MDIEKPKWVSHKFAQLDKYDYNVIEDPFDDERSLIVVINVGSDVDVRIADISTEVNSCDGYAYIDGKQIKVDRFQLRAFDAPHEKGSKLLLFSHLI